MRTDGRCWVAVVKIPFPFVPLSFLSCCGLVESVESEMRLPEVGQTGPELPVWLFQCERHYYWQQASKYALYPSRSHARARYLTPVDRKLNKLDYLFFLDTVASRGACG